jgi:hypothetical protein
MYVVIYQQGILGSTHDAWVDTARKRTLCATRRHLGIDFS